MKATSQISLYANDPALRAGVVMFGAGQLAFFPLETAIQPDNPHPIPYALIQQRINDGTFEMLGQLPANFPQLIAAAINASITMKPIRKQHFLQRL